MNEQEKQNRIIDLKLMLAGTDYWELPTYRASKTELENQTKDAQRVAWRIELRGLQSE